MIRWITTAAVIVVAGAWVHFAAGTAPAPAARLTVFDVGQGDSMLLEPASGPPILIDTGGAPYGSPFDIGARVLVPGGRICCVVGDVR